MTDKQTITLLRDALVWALMETRNPTMRKMLSDVVQQTAPIKVKRG
jgi:spore coat protein CotF